MSPPLSPSSSTTQHKKTLEYLTVQAQHQHKRTFIILHGRGSNANLFGPALLNTTLLNGKTFQQALSDVKFVFPTATLKRAAGFNRSLVTQWFDCKPPMDRSGDCWEGQIEGLRETVGEIHRLLRQEIDVVGPENVVLGGLSQGCAAALIALLVWSGEPLGAVFGMSGWLPFESLLSTVGNQDKDDGEDDIFERAHDSTAEDVDHLEIRTPFHRASTTLRDHLDYAVDEASDAVLGTPIFIGHGALDAKVGCLLGESASLFLRSLGFDVVWHRYDDLGHWYNSEELKNIIQFTQNEVKSEVNVGKHLKQ